MRNMKNKSMYKRIGAIAIIGLFLIASMATISMAKNADRQSSDHDHGSPQGSPGVEPSEPEVPNEALDWDGVGDLPYNDGDGVDGGMFLYDTYTLSGSDVDFDTSPCPVPPIGVVKPQYICARIMIYRGPDWPFEFDSKFKTRIRNIGAPDIGIIGPDVKLSAFHPLTLGFTSVKVNVLPIMFPIPGVGFRTLETGSILWYASGGCAWVKVDPEDNVDEYYDGILSFRPRFRYFVGNLYCPLEASIGYFNV